MVNSKALPAVLCELNSDPASVAKPFLETRGNWSNPDIDCINQGELLSKSLKLFLN